MAYTAIDIEGGLISTDMLDAIARGDVEGQKAADFRLTGSRRLTDEIQSAFSDARLYWQAFQRRLERSRESKTTLTREDWMVSFLSDLLGFDNLRVQRSSAEAGGQTFFISHRRGDHPNAVPIHIASIEQDLDRLESSHRRSPHGLVQDYLNRADALWGIATNGRQIRLLRNSVRVSKPTYLEFDVNGIVEGNLYSEFALLYRLTHSTRFPIEDDNPDVCLLETYFHQSIDDGSRVREHLREGVEDALQILGDAFMRHPGSGELRDAVKRGRLDSASYYRQLLSLIYRLLFLMVAEERRLIFPEGSSEIERQSIYTRYYSVAQLRERCERYFAGDNNVNLWIGLRKTFGLFRDNSSAMNLGLSALNGELFGSAACRDLEGASCTNEELLRAIRRISSFREAGSQQRRINYAGLDVEEFGSVYESLLDFQPRVSLEPPSFELVAGSERKQTGSYYTPPELVRELIKSALVPVVQERLSESKDKESKERALLALRVCDPAAGSGHFLLAAARRIATELARVRSGEDEPSPGEYREALRDVIRHCIYAVDKNPLAVDLCKVALWIEGHNAGLPLSFLDNHIKCGDSLVGVFDLTVLSEGIPDDAYKPVTGDDKAAAKYYRDRNREERKGKVQLTFGGTGGQAELPDNLAEDFETLGLLAERTPDDVHAKESMYEALRGRETGWWKMKVACDLWTSAFFSDLQREGPLNVERVPTTGAIRRHLETGSAHPVLVGQAVEAADTYSFFHWPIEFPDVFDQGGFDVVLGNPPWEQLQPEEIMFFNAQGAYDIAELAGAARKAAIGRLPGKNQTSRANGKNSRTTSLQPTSSCAAVPGLN